MANTGADGCAAPEAGIGIGGRPGLRFGDSGGCSAGTPGSELYIGSAANTGADGSAAPGPGTGADGGRGVERIRHARDGGGVRRIGGRRITRRLAGSGRCRLCGGRRVRHDYLAAG